MSSAISIPEETQHTSTPAPHFEMMDAVKSHTSCTNEDSPNKKRKMPNEAGSVGRLRRHTSRCHDDTSSISKPKRRFMVLVCSDGDEVACSFSSLLFFFALEGSTYRAPAKVTKGISVISVVSPNQR